MAEQMKPRRFKLRADHSQPQQPCPERIPVIGRARRRRTGIALRQRLIGDGKAELYVMPTEQVPNFCFERESPEDM